uniref:Uncharacterized protein n=1 Tax=viral metagenome TaxID=1070528 RepID=A0A6M3KKF0_9ZZZZ
MDVKGSILQECSKGYKLATRARLASAMVYDQVVFLDRANGSDSNSGEDWDNSVKTVNGAQDKIYGGSNDSARGRTFAIILRGRTTSGLKFTETQTIDISGVHLLGAGTLFGGFSGESCFILPLATTSNSTGLDITVSDVAIEGLKFYNPDSTEAEHSFIRVRDAIEPVVLDNAFIGSNNNGDITSRYSDGIDIQGCEGGLFAGNNMYYLYKAIKMGSGASRYMHKCVIEENFIQGSAYGMVDVAAEQLVTENLIKKNYILRKTQYGFTMVSGIDFAIGNNAGNLIMENYVGHATPTTAYTKGSGTNYWINNWYALSGGTKYAEE